MPIRDLTAPAWQVSWPRECGDARHGVAVTRGPSGDWRIRHGDHKKDVGEMTQTAIDEFVTACHAYDEDEDER